MVKLSDMEEVLLVFQQLGFENNRPVINYTVVTEKNNVVEDLGLAQAIINRFELLRTELAASNIGLHYSIKTEGQIVSDLEDKKSIPSELIGAKLVYKKDSSFDKYLGRSR